MPNCTVSIRLDKKKAVYQAGDTLKGTAVFLADERIKCRKLVVEYYWETHGKGNRNQEVIGRQEDNTQQLSPGLPYSVPFSFTVPAYPVTYHGDYLNVDHYIKAKADLAMKLDPHAVEEILVEPATGTREAYVNALAGNPQPLGKAVKPGPGTSIVAWSVFALVVAVLMAVFLPLGIIVCAIGGTVALVRYLARKKLGSLHCELAQSDLSRGESGTFVLRFRPDKPLQINAITTKLACDEVCVSGSGTNKTTHRKTVYEQQAELARNFAADHRSDNEFSAPVAIPQDAGLTFSSPSNDLKWQLHVRVDIPNWPDYKETIPIRVLPK